MAAIGWQGWALLSAVFAALTAILAKVGVEGVDPDVATFIRTLVIVVILGTLLLVTGQKIGAIPARAYLFLTLSGLATGASWLCYFRALSLGDAAQVAPLDKLSVVLVAIFADLSWRAADHAGCRRHRSDHCRRHSGGNRPGLEIPSLCR
jgi:bacterial/archaeal transporter family protein